MGMSLPIQLYLQNRWWVKSEARPEFASPGLAQWEPRHIKLKLADLPTQG